jgi:hypothetical protein
MYESRRDDDDDDDDFKSKQYQELPELIPFSLISSCPLFVVVGVSAS